MRKKALFPRILAGGRNLIMIAVVCSFGAAIVTLCYGGFQTINSIGMMFSQHEISSQNSKKLVVAMIEVIDLFLLGTVFYITALGLYELFISDDIEVPEWLEIHTIDDLKGKLISVVVVVLGVLFLGQAVTWDGQTNLLPFGASVGIVITSLTYFLIGQHKTVGKVKKLPHGESSSGSRDD
jgi:uncharacterized membrane protein YqhA